MIRHLSTACCMILLASAAGTAWASDIAEAAKNGDIATVRALLNEQADPNVPMLDGSTALHWAANEGDLELAELLIDGGANPNAITRNGVTPITLAAIKGSAGMLELLLDTGVDANGDALLNGETPMMLASRTGSTDAVRVLLDYGADIRRAESIRGTTALMWAVAENHSEVTQLLIDRGADVNAQSTIVELAARSAATGVGEFAASFAGGFTALVIGARERSPESIRVLLDAGANPNQTAADGTSPLVMASMNGDFDVANMILEAGGDPNLVNDKLWHPLFFVVDLRNEEYGVAPVPHETTLSATEFMRILLDNGADPNVQSIEELVYRTPNSRRPYWKLRSTGATPFMRAAMSGDVEGMRMLLAYGADPELTLPDGTTPLMAAAGLGWGQGFSYDRSEAETIESMQFLLAIGADVNAQRTTDEATPLHGAAHKGSTASVQFLLDNGGDLSILDNGRWNQNQVPLLPLNYAYGFTFQLSGAFVETTARQPATANQIEQLMAQRGIPIPDVVHTLGGGDGSRRSNEN